MGFSVETKGEPIHYCELPGWRIRRRLHVQVGTIIRCHDCGLRWQWQFRGWADLSAGWVPVVKKAK